MNADFYITIMDHAFHIYPIHEEIRGMFRQYRTEPDPEAVEIHITEKMMKHEKEIMKDDVSYSDLQYEKTAVHRAITELLLKEKIFLIHGSALCKDGQAFLFTGVSGAGKSTHARLWRELFQDEITMINDDKPYLKIENDHIIVYGSPWNGKHHLGSNTHAPLKAIGFIHQSDKNECIPVSKKDAFLPIFTQIYRPENSSELKNTMDCIHTLIDTIPIYDIYCTKDTQAARISHDTMNGN